jgi:hypothetical protein
MKNRSTVLDHLSARALSLLAQPNYGIGPTAAAALMQRVVTVRRASVVVLRWPAARVTRCVGSGGYGTSGGWRVHWARSRRLKHTVAAGRR